MLDNYKSLLEHNTTENTHISFPFNGDLPRRNSHCLLSMSADWVQTIGAVCNIFVPCANNCDVCKKKLSSDYELSIVQTKQTIRRSSFIDW